MKRRAFISLLGGAAAWPRGFEGVGGAWNLPPTDETFDARFGQW